MNLKSIFVLVTTASFASGALALPACTTPATHLDRAKQMGQTTAKPGASLPVLLEQLQAALFLHLLFYFSMKDQEVTVLWMGLEMQMLAKMFSL